MAAVFKDICLDANDHQALADWWCAARIRSDTARSTPELVAAGAKLVRARDGEVEWDVLEDPEGNEFCVFTPNET
ncbi:VOC family protein [Amycolatopsis sp. lyj-108]|uniref:VOC family protein n=1 Tax=Amycolatopsis sp. lyj-108 TaxID=2789286 RepID=UPI0039796ED4